MFPLDYFKNTSSTTDLIGVGKQVAQSATIAHLRANFTFSYCKSMGDDDPRGLANLDPRGMIGRIYVGYH